MDYSTINVDELAQLPIYKEPPTYRIDNDPGNGCFLDAPGYPTYFTRNVWTQHGNHPRNEEILVINDLDGNPHVVSKGYPRNDLRDLWVPLPIEHGRVQTWIAVCYSYFHGCYANPSKGADWRNVSYMLREGPPEHHLAVLAIQEFYPEHTPDIEKIEHNTNAYGSSGDWWERG
jgi:hypothetical protein